MVHLDRFNGGRAIKAHLVQLTPTPQYQQGLKERYKVERKFGEAKRGTVSVAVVTWEESTLLCKLSSLRSCSI